MPLQEFVSFEAAKSGRKRQKTAGTEHLRRFFGRRLMACCKPLRRLFSSQNRRKLVANFCGGFFPSEVNYDWMLSKTLAAAKNRQNRQR
jgi:hypothetical protein